MAFEYSGYLKSLLPTVDESGRDQLEGITFSAEDMAQWTSEDREADKEWQEIPAHRSYTENGVRLVGRFEDIIPIDNLSVEDARFWVPLSTLEWEDERFPVDVSTYPILEVTYRCTSENGRPACICVYPGGWHQEALPPSMGWRTVARKVQHFGFPDQIAGLIFRLYSPTRTTESMEIASVRFRAMSSAEAEVCQQDGMRLDERRPPKRYRVLDKFVPLGTFVDAGTARRLAEMLGISLGEYWTLMLEDIVRHHHNCIALEKVDQLTAVEWQELLGHSEAFGIKILAMHDLALADELSDLSEFIESRIKPYASSASILAWSLRRDPGEGEFSRLEEIRSVVEEADPHHPLTVTTRHATAYPLYAPFFAASGIEFDASHAPWEVAELVRTHAPLCGGQQFWLTGPAYVSATGMPEWSICAELRLMMNLAFANGARGWFTFAYHNDPIWIGGSCQRSLTGPFLAFSDLWAELDKHMERFHTLAPLLAQAQPEPLLDEWYAWSSRAEDHAQFPDGVSPTSSYQLKGPDYDLYIIVSNDVRGMSRAHINIPAEVMKGLEIYDVSDFVQGRQWKQMPLQRDLQMFPGQAHILLVGKPEVCVRWRDVLASRLIEDDHRQLTFDLQFARTYGLAIGDIEKMIAGAGKGDVLKDLGKMDRARERLLNKVYDSPTFCEARSWIIKATAMVCACDGALCRLLHRGQVGQVKELGQEVVPLAREIINLRLELRAGRGGTIVDHGMAVADRAQHLLARIRAVS